MLNDIHALLEQAKREVLEANSLSALALCRVDYLGKQGKFMPFLKQLGQLPPEERPKAGQIINVVKQALEDLITQKTSELEFLEVQSRLDKEKLDVSLPGRGQELGTLHPIAMTRSRIEAIFSSMGFAMVAGPEIEDDVHNFAALNIPEFHPARAMQDTFYIDDGRLLRTHMSPVQIRTMKTTKPPLRVIAPGRVYRRDFDVTHTPMFHQVEGLYVDEGVNFAHLKSIMHSFLNAFFDQEVVIRFRSSYFPFTEPSAEVDMRCLQCGGKGCRVCSQTGWLEVLGCGMVHPNVFRAVGIDPEKYTGFAFGLGYDRLTMLYYGVNDLRLFFENDLRFLQQF